MKKLLIASTALVATAGVAAAEVNVGGTARFGLQYTNWLDMNPAQAGVQSWGIEKRMTINIDGSGETDGGMEFGGRIRLRSDEYIGTAASGANVYIGMGGFRVTVGNINGALEMMPGLYANKIGMGTTAGPFGVGWTGNVLNAYSCYWCWDSFSSRGNGAEGIALDYSGGSFGAHLSHGTVSGNTAISGSYSFGDWTVALGGQRDGVAGASIGDVVVGIVSGSFGDFGVNLAIADRPATFGTRILVGGSYSSGDFTVRAFAARENDPTWLTAHNSFGIGGAYNMGGATLTGGFTTIRNVTSWNQADFGIEIAF